VTGTDGRARRNEIAARLTSVRSRIAAACDRNGRDSDDVVLVAVTKGFPASDVTHLLALGVGDIGENRAAEAAAKVAAVGEGPRWHFVGQLQTNKCRTVAGFAHAVHSVDRPRLVDALSRAAVEAGRTVDVFVQVLLDPDGAGAQRGGATPGDVSRICTAVAEADGLRLAGVMGVAPLGGDPEPAFARLAAISAAVRAEHPGAGAISAGMSGDLDAAIAAGATHVRVGTALLGSRPPLVR
jgi:PLP dependent protein